MGNDGYASRFELGSGIARGGNESPVSMRAAWSLAIHPSPRFSRWKLSFAVLFDEIADFPTQEGVLTRHVRWIAWMARQLLRLMIERTTNPEDAECHELILSTEWDARPKRPSPKR